MCHPQMLLSSRALLAGVLVVGILSPVPEVARADALDVNGTELAALEKKVRAVVRKVLPAVVAVRSRSGFASGVLISEDGLILSQAHVSHRGRGPAGENLPAGMKTAVILHETEVEAELLGADLFNDVSLLRLTKPGKYPFVALEGSLPRVGDPVLHLGHPLGFRPGRTPPLRLARVVSAGQFFFATDCPIIGGDSGGPFFDLDGRLIGIIRDSQIPSAVLLECGLSGPEA